MSLFKYSAEGEARQGFVMGGGVQRGSGCDMEYSDGGGKIHA